MRTIARLAALILLAGLLAIGTPAQATPAQAAARKGHKKVHTKVFKVPTRSGLLGRIATAKNGTMWYADYGVGVGRVTAKGAIKEFTPDDDPDVLDLDTSPDGTVWVLYDEYVVQLSSSGTTLHTYNLQHGGAGWAIRVTRNGDAWVLATHTSYSLQRIHDGTISSAKLCTHTEGNGGLGAGSDGRLWCSTNARGSKATRVNAAGTHGKNHRLSSRGAVDGYSLSLAAGATGRVWFGRYDKGADIDYDGTAFAGRVGFVRANGKVKKFNTGSKTAPDQLVRRPGTKQVWFVNNRCNCGEGTIGHINPKGRGGIHTVGGHKAVALTFDHHGRIWFTDDSHDAIVRVRPKELMTTNVALGRGSVLDPKPRLRTGNLKKYKHPVHIRKHRFFKLRHNCPHKASKCRARVKTTSKKKIHGKHRVIAKPRTVKTAAGKHHSVKLKLTKKGRKLMKHHKVLKVKVRLYLPHHKKPSKTRTIRLHR